MTVIYNPTVEAGRLQVGINAIDAGPSNGFMRLLDPGGNVLSSFQLARPSATVAGNVATFNGLSLIDPSAAGSGSVVAARCEDSVGTVVISGLSVGVNGSGADITMAPGIVITAGQTIALTAAQITGN